MKILLLANESSSRVREIRAEKEWKIEFEWRKGKRKDSVKKATKCKIHSRLKAMHPIKVVTFSFTFPQTQSFLRRQWSMTRKKTQFSKLIYKFSQMKETHCLNKSVFSSHKSNCHWITGGVFPIQMPFDFCTTIIVVICYVCWGCCCKD